MTTTTRIVLAEVGKRLNIAQSETNFCKYLHGSRKKLEFQFDNNAGTNSKAMDTKLYPGKSKPVAQAMSSSDPRHFVTSLRSKKVLACLPSPVMDYVWCFGSGDWAQTQSDSTGTGGFFDENINHLQWNSSTCNTPAPIVPDSTPFTFGLEMGFNGTPKNCRRKSSTTQAPLNTSTSASDVTVADETIPGMTTRLDIYSRRTMS
ncbi:hypothetical protein B0H13DRAFT_1853073 [Mycena leptocephala]|nr:hypothetical protein B0H13DRAFT_1853073 [Mycena leptocephala]